MALRKLATYENSIEAENVKVLLLSNGINPLVLDETLNKAIVSGNLAGYSISVEESDYDRAKVLVLQEEQQRQDFLPWCPDCGSEEVSYQEIIHHHGPTWELVVCIVFLCAAIIVPLIASFKVVLYPGLLVIVFAIDWIRGGKEKIYTCQKCGKVFKKQP